MKGHMNKKSTILISTALLLLSTATISNVKASQVNDVVFSKHQDILKQNKPTLYELSDYNSSLYEDVIDAEIPIDLSDYDFNQTEMEEMLKLIYKNYDNEDLDNQTFTY